MSIATARSRLPSSGTTAPGSNTPKSEHHLPASVRTRSKSSQARLHSRIVVIAADTSTSRAKRQNSYQRSSSVETFWCRVASLANKPEAASLNTLSADTGLIPSSLRAVNVSGSSCKLGSTKLLDPESCRPPRNTKFGLGATQPPFAARTIAPSSQSNLISMVT